MTDFIYHNTERKKLGVDFSPVLASGETLSSPSVTVLTGTSWEGSDVTSDIIGSPAASVNGSIVNFWVDGELSTGLYAVVVSVSTSDSRVLVGKKDQRPFILSVID